MRVQGSRAAQVCGAALCAALVACTPRGPTQTCTPAWPGRAARSAAARDARRAGELVVVVDGRRVSFDLSILWYGDTAFLADLVGPFGSAVATVESGPGTLVLTVGTRVQHIDPSSRVDEYVDFVRSPFTFGDFARILSGEYVSSAAPDGEPDSLVAARRTVRGVWLSESVRSTALMKTRGCRTAELTVEEVGEGWQVRLSGLREGVAARSEFRLDERNYFVLTFK